MGEANLHGRQATAPISIRALSVSSPSPASSSMPDEAAEPRRLRGIFATLVLGLVIWGILKLLVAGVREHHG